MSKLPKKLPKSSKQVISQTESTADQLIEAFLFLCSETGPAHVTLEKIASASGFSFGTVRYHFAGDKPDIFSAAVQHIIFSGVGFVQAEIDLARKSPAYDPLDAYIHANFEWMRAYPTHSSYLVYYYALCSTKVPLVINAKTFLTGGRNRIESLIFEGIGRKIYPSLKDITVAAMKIHSLITGTCMVGLSERSSKALLIQEKHAKEMVRVILSASQE